MTLATPISAPPVCRCGRQAPADPALGPDDVALCPRCGDAYWTDGTFPPSPVDLDALPIAPMKRQVIDRMRHKIRVERCAAVWEDQRKRLAQLAQRALARALDGRKVLIVCIEVDSSWRFLVDQLTPGHDWEAARARGQGEWARGSVMRAGFVEPMAQLVPSMAKPLGTRPPRGRFHAVVMVNGYASLYLLEPQPEPS